MSLIEQSRPRRVRILLADDHPQVRGQLAARLSRELDFDVIGMAANSMQALKEAKAKQPDMILIDPIMRDGLGLAMLRQICANVPNMVVVVLTAFIDTTLDIQLRELGIRHILAKGISTSQLLTELRAASGTSTHFFGQ